MTMRFTVNERLNISNDYCTVRYVGEIPNWPKEVAIGLDWDQLERGKNDGSLDGVRYFQTIGKLASGSFMKASSKKLKGCQGISFVRALCDKYGKGMSRYKSFDDLFNNSDRSTTLVKERDLNIEEIKLGSKIVESYGFEKLDLLQSNFQGLEVISLNRCNVSNNDNEFDHSKDIAIHSVVPSLKILDLSFNLFISLEEVLSIVLNTKIEKLILNGNKFSNCEIKNGYDDLLSLKYISLAETFIQDLSFVNRFFPGVEEVDLSANNFNEDTDLDEILKLTHLRSLNLAFNNFNNMKPLSKFTELTKLVLNNNNINFSKADFQMPHVIELDVRENDITTWPEIDNINQCFPNLQKLRINGNPITRLTDLGNETANEIDQTTIEIIARMNPKVSTLNRSTISPSERESYELYLISQIRQTPSSYEQFLQTTRCKVLFETYKYDIRDLIRDDDTITGRLSANLIKLNFQVPNGQGFHKSTFKYYDVGTLKGIVSRELDNISVLEFQIYYQVGPNLKEYLQDNLAIIQSTGISNEDTLYVEFIQQEM